MKIKSKQSLIAARRFAIVLSIAIALVGCSSGNLNDASMASATKADQQAVAMPMQAESKALGGASAHVGPAMTEAASANAPAQKPAVIQKRDVIRTVDLKVRVLNTEEAEKKANNIIAEIGGYVDSEEASNLSGQTPTMVMHARIPVGSFESVIAAIEKLGTRLDKNIKSNDVTEQIVDMDARMKTLTAEEDSLRNMLRETRDLNNSMSLQERLTNLRGQIESMQAQRKSLGGQAALSTLNLTFEQSSAVAAPPSSDPNWFAQSWGQASSAGITVGRGLVILSLWLLVFSPVVCVIYAVSRGARKAFAKAVSRQAAPIHAPDPTHFP